MSTSLYPVRVDATLDPDLSRWLWLVKWLLAIPHYVLLALLWVAFALLSVFALVAILVTGRYPRGIFDFNVGVLRWSWRVAYYSYDGLGTDRYPPFTLAERPDYPAHLDIAYPEHLSRGLVLVKWWLLAIPQYLVVALFLGSGFYVAQMDETATRGWAGGLIGLLVFFAAVVLLFTGRYPRAIFDLVLGLNRWVLRVAAYAALMTDEYPPFRLDLGGQDPATSVLTVQAPTASVPGASGLRTDEGTAHGAPGPGAGATPPTRWGAGRIVAVVAGSVLAMTSLGILGVGGVLQVADSGLRDGQGYLMSSSSTYSSRGYAVTSSSVELHTGSTQVDLPRRWLGTVKVRVDPGSAEQVFVGLARTSDVDAYLAGVAHSVVRDPAGADGRAVARYVPGRAPRVDPGQATFWEASSGTGRPSTLTWEPRAGDWTLLVMNRDASAPVSADVAVGAEVPVLGDVALALLIAGGVLLVVSLALLVAALRRVPTT
jgi:hypothetical protein